MKYSPRHESLLLLEDGTLFTGYALGKKGTSGGELCFNTGMTGYQEIYTDPSYYGQIIINTTSHIGNYGTLDKENQSYQAMFNGLVCDKFSQHASRQNAGETLQDYLEREGIVGISDIDTRKLVRHIRSKGAMNAIISSEIKDLALLQEELEKVPSMLDLELSSKVTTTQAYELNPDGSVKLAVIDYGIKKNILNHLVERGFHCKVFSAQATLQELNEWQPDAFFLSNGPGDPGAMGYAVNTVKEILETKKPIFGICLGHQLLAKANGATTFKMHHGHRGLNHPVLNLVSGKGEITSQNHGFAVKKEDIENNENVELTHIHLNDDSVAGIRMKNQPAFSVQYHPEAAPGPHDSHYLFDEFWQMTQ